MIDCMIEKHNGNLYIAGRFFHLLGSGIYHVCIPLFLLDKTNSLISTTIYFTIIHIPTLLSLLFIGVWLEKRDLKKCLLISNFLSFSIYLIIYLFIVERTFDLNFYIIISFLENINYSAYNVINSSIFSRIIKKDNIEKTNGKKVYLKI